VGVQPDRRRRSPCRCAGAVRFRPRRVRGALIRRFVRSFGDAVIVELLKDKGLLPATAAGEADVVVFPFAAAQRAAASGAASQLRAAGVATDLVLEVPRLLSLPPRVRLLSTEGVYSRDMGRGNRSPPSPRPPAPRPAGPPRFSRRARAPRVRGAGCRARDGERRPPPPFVLIGHAASLTPY